MANEIYDSTWWGNTIDTASSIGTSTEMIQGQFNMLTSNQPNLVVNGDFATDTDWTLGSGSTISGGSLNIVLAPYNATTRQVLYLTSGATYKVTFNATAVGSASDNTFQLGFGDSSGNPSNTTQVEFDVGSSVKTLIITASSTDASIIFRSRDASTSNLTIDNVSVKEVRATTVEASKCLADAIHRIGIQDIQN